MLYLDIAPLKLYKYCWSVIGSNEFNTVGHSLLETIVYTDNGR